MKVLFQYLGYAFKLLAIILAIHLSWVALNLAHQLYGLGGFLVGLLLLPLTVPVAISYQGWVEGAWLHVIELWLFMPLWWVVGSVLIRRGRVA